MKRSALLLFALLAFPLAAEPEYPKMGPDIYDVKADGKTQIAAALAKATTAHKRVLVVFGANWCVWCHRLHGTFESNAQVATALRDAFEVVRIDVNARHGVNRNADVDARYGHPTQEGLPVLVVLDADGKQLTTQESGALEEGSGHSPAKIIAFLDKWKPAG